MTTTAVVLAAGLGTRMKSHLAKVLHPLAGRPMVGWVVHALREAGVDRVVLVVHHQEEQVREAIAGVAFARQDAPRGTGDALAAALDHLPAEGRVVVLAGDTPLVTGATVARLLRGARGHATVASFAVADPTGYGRIVRDGGLRIVEEAEASAEQKAIREVNAGAYVFEAAYLHARLPHLSPHPPKGEFYLTDLVDAQTHVVDGFDATEFLGVNDRAALATARGVLRRRINTAWALTGVDFADLETISVGADVVLHPGAALGPGAVVEGRSDVAGEIGACCVVRDCTVHAGAVVHAGSVCDGAVVYAGAKVGPMARLRPGAVIESGAHIGNFVEVKNTVVRTGAKANHLAYLGDADVGPGANVGAGTITCNYDGVRKNRTEIGAGAFIGSNSALVAPVTIGAGAIVGAGSTVAEEVPADAIAVGRAKLAVTRGAADRLRRRYRLLAAEAAKGEAGRG